MPADIAPEPIRLLTITRKGEPVSRQFVLMIERRLFARAIEDWAIPTLLRLVRACTRQDKDLELLRQNDPWVARLYDYLNSHTLPPPVAAVPQPEASAPENVSLITAPAEMADLSAIWKKLIEQYFPDRPDLLSYRIVWSKRRHTSTLASCQAVKRVVRVAAIMGRPEALPYLEPLIYHELCHAVLGPIKEVNGRRVIHGREFKMLERSHSGIPSLNAWINSGGWRRLVTSENRRSGFRRLKKRFGR